MDFREGNEKPQHWPRARFQCEYCGAIGKWHDLAYTEVPADLRSQHGICGERAYWNTDICIFCIERFLSIRVMVRKGLLPKDLSRIPAIQMDTILNLIDLKTAILKKRKKSSIYGKQRTKKRSQGASRLQESE